MSRNQWAELASRPVPSSVHPPVKLILRDRTCFEGRSFGARRTVQGEVVFNTGMTGYVEALTDPSYRGQILVLTYPLQGNYGVPRGKFESRRVQVQGLVVQHYTDTPSHHLAVHSLGAWLKAEGVPAMDGICAFGVAQENGDHFAYARRYALARTILQIVFCVIDGGVDDLCGIA